MTKTTIEITASELRHGDIVVCANDGERLFAAFDLTIGEDDVTVYTAVSDWDRGVDHVITLPLTASITIQRTTN